MNRIKKWFRDNHIEAIEERIQMNAVTVLRGNRWQREKARRVLNSDRALLREMRQNPDKVW